MNAGYLGYHIDVSYHEFGHNLGLQVMHVAVEKMLELNFGTFISKPTQRFLLHSHPYMHHPLQHSNRRDPQTLINVEYGDDFSIMGLASWGEFPFPHVASFVYS